MLISENFSSQWGVYCTIIKHCCVSNLTLCGDEGIERFVKKITDSIQTNTKLHSLTLCKIGKIGAQSIKDVISNCTTLKNLNVLGKSIETTHNQFVINSTKLDSNYHEGMIDINVSYNVHNEYSSKVIDKSNKGISYDELCFITLGLYNNTSVQILDLSCNKITDDGAVIISDCLKYNNTIKELNLSQNYIKTKGMNALSEYINYVPLEHIDLSGNISSPWGVYCAIIRDCCVYNLTLCGDEGIKEHAEEITNNIQANQVLYSLTLYSQKLCSMGRYMGTVIKIGDVHNFQSSVITISGNRKVNNRVVNINVPLHNGDSECLSEFIDLSNKGINDDMVCLLTFCLYNNTIIKKLDLSCNDISDNGMNILLKCVKSTTSLEYVDLTANYSSPWGVYCAVIRHCSANSLTLCGDKGIKEHVDEIIDSLQTNISLRSLTLYRIGNIGLQSMKDILDNNTTLKELYMSNKYKGTMIIHRKLTHHKFNNMNNYKGVDVGVFYEGDYETSSEAINISYKIINYNEISLITFALYNNTTVKQLNLPCNNITDDGVIVISECLKNNSTLQELNLTGNCITSKGAKKISEALCINKYLYKIDVSYNAIHDDGVVYISECLKHNNTLAELNLSKNGITDKGLKMITEAIQLNAALQKLYLLHNLISDDGMDVKKDSRIIIH